MVIDLQKYKEDKQKMMEEILGIIEPTITVNTISYEDMVKQYKEYYATTSDT